MICPPAVDLATVLHAVKGSECHRGRAEYALRRGRRLYRRNLSLRCLLPWGSAHVILGHSERRQYFGETDETVNRKLVTALKHHLIPIVCIGEHEEQGKRHDGGRSCARQISRAIHQIDASKAAPMIIAYEPIWAIGTGKTATPVDGRRSPPDHPQRGSAHGRQTARRALRILYGGSVKPENAEALLSQPEIDGALVGGASLDPHSLLVDRQSWSSWLKDPSPTGCGKTQNESRRDG